MKILFIGDVSGAIGQKMVKDYLPRLRQRYKPQAVILNGENASAGRGINERIYKKFLSQGVDCVTMGNHTWGDYEIYDFIDETDRLIRPANYPNNEFVPGKGISYIKINQQILAVINLSGRTYMADYADPFRVGDELIEEAKKKTDHIFIDIHAEVTSEKKALALHFDGKVSAVIGTHTHVQTNDERILSGGTAFLTDVGMTGFYDGILGMNKEPIIKRFRTQLPARFKTPEAGRGQLNACIIETNDKTGRARSIKTIRIDGDTLFMD
ncbi:MAG: TIGR00282 family metallophosphoesterase [Atopostipes suicloacalis]|nr:TIGR00282 family metallophosphoesterase [Atopostipes suicloacalis]